MCKKAAYARNIVNKECLTGMFWGGSLGWGVPFRTPRDNRPAWSGDEELELKEVQQG